MLALLLLQLAGISDPTPMNSWFDYPGAAIRNEEQGVVKYEAQVDANGRVTDCRVTSSSGSASLDEETCRQTVRRARFKPATNAAGDLVAGTYHGKMNWSLSTN